MDLDRYPPPRPQRSGYGKGFNTTMGVLAALFVVFVLLPLAGCIGCMMLATTVPDDKPTPQHSLTQSPHPSKTKAEK